LPCAKKYGKIFVFYEKRKYLVTYLEGGAKIAFVIDVLLYIK
jgi:hypothetical protein